MSSLDPCLYLHAKPAEEADDVDDDAPPPQQPVTVDEDSDINVH